MRRIHLRWILGVLHKQPISFLGNMFINIFVDTILMNRIIINDISNDCNSEGCTAMVNTNNEYNYEHCCKLRDCY